MEDNMEITDRTVALDEIAMGIASVTLELMEDSVDWQLEDFPQDGEEYSAIHSEVMLQAVTIMLAELTRSGIDNIIE